MHLCLFLSGFVHVLAMAARPEQKSRVRTLIDELVGLVGSEWATTIDQPFAITCCTERTVIFDLRFRMKVGDEDPVIMRDDIIGWRLHWEGVTRAMTPTKQEDEGPSSPPREKEPASENEEATPPSLESSASNLEDDTGCWAVKRKIDYTLALEDIWSKHLRGRGGIILDGPDHHTKVM